MSDQFSAAYYMIMSVALKGTDMVEELNRRTNTRIRMLPGGASFRVDMSDGLLPVIGCRRTYPKISAAENAWCLVGDNHVDWLRRYTTTWDQFADIQDCATCEGVGTISAPGAAGYDFGERERCPSCREVGKTHWLSQAYGYRWKYAFGVDQLAFGLERLEKDPSDRRVWVSSWDPREDILDNGQKTVPCPVGFTLSVMNRRLCSSLMIRSSDLYFGLPYDVMRHALLMDACAATLGITTGIMRVTMAHPHVYQPQWQDASRMLAQKSVVPSIAMPHWPVKDVAGMPDEYVKTIRAVSTGVEWPKFTGDSGVVA